MAVNLPSLSTPPLLGQSWTPQWAQTFQAIKAELDTLNRVSAAVPAATATVSAAPASYNQTWGAEVVAMLNDIKAQQAAIVAALQTAGLMEV